ncbi:hypothetical protein QBC38DRAFT_66716 [Podospora fimiseda]|uniref:Uncharacterized protein n=1 Tax=Podospora fimiseda TaxID=252190 RepID=A0AAN6YRL0_9PEZI|nr:hypothetical protein QBC38DRAFT_66716 [Podospora fimiseda]
MGCVTGACPYQPPSAGGPHKIRPDGFHLQQNNGRDRAPRRPTYFNRTIHEISVRLQYPDLISFREVMLAIVVLYATFKAVFAGIKVYDLLFQREVSFMCRGLSAMGCVWIYFTRYLFGILLNWGSDVVPWAIFAAVVTFFGEEVLRKIKTKK